MDEKCKFCGETLKEEAKKCTTCSEFRGIRGWVLRYLPIASIILGLGSFAIAIYEIDAREEAVVRKNMAVADAKTAEKERLAVTRELYTKDRAADDALRDIAQKLPARDRESIMERHRLKNTNLQQLEREAKTAPDDREIQRKLYILRAFKRPN